MRPICVRFRLMTADAAHDPITACGDLLLRAQETAQRARHSGALQPIETSVHHIDQGGVRFIVRVLAGVAGQAAAQARRRRATLDRPTPANPFLPPDPALVVASLTPTHLCVLNKFPVVAHHLLIVTREFEAQETLLTRADFAALSVCTQQVTGLAFYNSGKVAGASQRHKHLQLAPFPLEPDGVAAAPIEALLGEPIAPGEPVQHAQLPFRHALLWLPRDAATNADFLADRYQALLAACGVWAGGSEPPQPYNWLATSRWMLVAPRTREAVDSMAVNALGFAGSLLVRDAAQLAWLQSLGPWAALDAVSAPASGAP